MPTERGPKSWEFLMRLLVDPKTNPSLVKWEDEEEGTFRLTEPTLVAKLWGARSNKQYLSYVNFARGIRYFMLIFFQSLFHSNSTPGSKRWELKLI